MLMMNDFGSMAPSNMMPPSFNPMCQGLFEHQMPKPRLAFKMPRVVPDQKNKFQTDDLFKRLSRESDVSTRQGNRRPRPGFLCHFFFSLFFPERVGRIISNARLPRKP